MTTPPSVVHLDRSQLRTLAHPLRHRLLSALRIHGPATATALAERLSTNTGKTSYHLRQLAAVGLVTEDAARGNARDRWWRAAHDVSAWSLGELGDDDSRAAADWLLDQAARMNAAKIARWISSRADRSPDWLAAADMSDLRLRLSPERLRSLNDELLAVVTRYLADQDPADAPDTVECTVVLAGFPDPDPMW